MEFKFAAVSFQDPVYARKAHWDCICIVKTGGERTGSGEWIIDSKQILDGERLKTTSSQERGKVLSGDKLRSFKN